MLVNFWRWFKFSLWYLRNPPWDTGISPPELLAFIAAHPAGRVLDMGCGTGTNMVTLAQAGWQVTGVDFVARAVRMAMRRIQHAGLTERVHVYVDDIANLKRVEGTFDLILDIGCYHALPDKVQVKYRANLKRLLAPGGYWLLYTRCRPESARAIGISEPHIGLLKKQWKLERRADGFDRADIPAAWFVFYNEQ